MPTQDTDQRLPAQARPATARTLTSLTSGNELWRYQGWAGAGGVALRIGIADAGAIDCSRTFDRKTWMAGCGGWLELPGPTVDFAPEDVGPNGAGRAAVRFASLWWDAVAVAFLNPRSVRLVDYEGGHLAHPTKLLVVLDADGEPRAALMPMSTTDREVERAWAEATAPRDDWAEWADS